MPGTHAELSGFQNAERVEIRLNDLENDFVITFSGYPQNQSKNGLTVRIYISLSNRTCYH
jgi:hypothetical protein